MSEINQPTFSDGKNLIIKIDQNVIITNGSNIQEIVELIETNDDCIEGVTKNNSNEIVPVENQGIWIVNKNFNI